jgi:hypothetical protein
MSPLHPDVEFQVMERWKALCQKYWISLIPDGPWANSSEEDAAAVLRGEIEILRWAAITQHDEIFYIKTFNTYQEAERASIEYVSDDIFTESPVALCDLWRGDREPWGLLYELVSLKPRFKAQPRPKARLTL